MESVSKAEFLLFFNEFHHNTVNIPIIYTRLTHVCNYMEYILKTVKKLKIKAF